MSGGNISLSKNDDADIKKYFEYAKTCGMPMIVCAPTHENLKKLEAAVKEYNIKRRDPQSRPGRQAFSVAGIGAGGRKGWIRGWACAWTSDTPSAPDPIR